MQQATPEQQDYLDHGASPVRLVELEPLVQLAHREEQGPMEIWAVLVPLV